MCFAYDAATKTVFLFGGGNNSRTVFLGDTWTWDGVVKTWTQQNPATSPSARRAPMTYDAAAPFSTLIPGFGMEPLGPNGFRRPPFPRKTNANMTYDAAIGAAVLFGGYAGILGRFSERHLDLERDQVDANQTSRGTSESLRIRHGLRSRARCSKRLTSRRGFCSICRQKNGVLIKPKRLADPDDVLTPAEALW